jgi:hypothetical protein
MATASDRAKALSTEHRSRRAAQQKPEPEVEYPHLEELRISHCVIMDQCPACQEVHGVDLGAMTGEEVPARLQFECESCETEWMIPLDLTELLGHRRPWRWVQEVDDHWSAELPGGHLMTVWGVLGGVDWTWEVWPQDRPNPDEPDFADSAATFEEACEAAERCAKEQGLVTT